MKLLITTFLFSVFVYHGNTIVVAFPTAAGGCNTGGAVGDSHLINPTTGSLSLGGFEILLDGTNALLTNASNIITPSKTYLLSVFSATDAQFRGALFRVNTGTLLEPGSNAVEATACTEAEGVCHFGNDLKTEFEANIQVDSMEDVTLEVTLVVANTANEGSIYYYDKFVLEPSGTAIGPVATPVAAPSMDDAPAVAPADVPVPVKAPATAPTPPAAPTSLASMRSLPGRALLLALVTGAILAIL